MNCFLGSYSPYSLSITQAAEVQSRLQFHDLHAIPKDLSGIYKRKPTIVQHYREICSMKNHGKYFDLPS